CEPAGGGGVGVFLFRGGRGNGDGSVRRHDPSTAIGRPLQPPIASSWMARSWMARAICAPSRPPAVASRRTPAEDEAPVERREKGCALILRRSWCPAATI